MPVTALLLVVAGVNLAAFVVMGRDKVAARRGNRRVSERHLWALAVLFGAAGIYAGMLLFRHKTAKPVFTALVPLLLLAQLFLLYRWLDAV